MPDEAMILCPYDGTPLLDTIISADVFAETVKTEHPNEVDTADPTLEKPAGARTSFFTVQEEKDFHHVYNMLDRSINFSVAVWQKKLDEKTPSKIRTDIFKTNLLSAIMLLVNKGYSYYDYVDLEIELEEPLKVEHTLASTQDIALDYGRPEIREDYSIELRKYGLLRHTSIVRFERTESVYEFTEKVHRFNYWLEVNELSNNNFSLVLVERGAI